MSKDHEPKPSEKPDTSEKSEHAGRSAGAEKPEKQEKPERSEKADREKTDTDKTDKEKADTKAKKHEASAEAEKRPEPSTREYETKSAAGTTAIGRRLVESLRPPRLLILRGDLGAGKTTLVKGIATALGAADEDEVTSPTFTLVHEYSGTLDGKHVKLLHLDLYRLDADRQLESLGLEEMRTEDALVLVEWGEKFPTIRSQADGEIAITSEGGDSRKIVVTLK